MFLQGFPELRTGNAARWEGSVELLDTCFANVPPDIREIRTRADAGLAFNPVLEALESQSAQYAVVARRTRPFRNLLPGLASNLVTAFQRTCLEPNWQSFTLQKLRFNLFLLPGAITRPQNRPVLRLKDSPFVQKTVQQILAATGKLKPL